MSHDSIYTVPDDAEGDARIFGVFEGQRCLGYRCSIKVERITEEQSGKDTRFRDMLGVRTARGDLAVHISGRDDYGGKGAAGQIEELGLYKIEMEPGQGRGPSGQGLGPEPDAVLLLSTSARHHAHWGGPDVYVTATGLLSYWLDSQPRERATPFSMDDVLDYIDALEARERSWKLAGDNPHRRAIRELCKLILTEQESAGRCWWGPSQQQGLSDCWGLKRRARGRFEWINHGPKAYGPRRKEA